MMTLINNEGGGKYLIEFQNGNRVKHAGTKAPADITTILCRNGFEGIFISTSIDAMLGKLKELVKVSCKALFAMSKESVVVIQYPVYSKTGNMIFKVLYSILKMKSMRLVALVHDVRSAQVQNYDRDEEIGLLNRFDFLIVHSEQMASYLHSHGCRTKCVALGLFDYLIEKGNSSTPAKSYEIAFAGNLKNGFLGHLRDLDERLVFRIYGEPRNYDIESRNVVYSGSFSPEDVSSISASWGLVWDGPSVESNTGQAGIYQQINSPHKASMYIVAGLPIIASSDAAIASIIRENKLGILVGSLYELFGILSRISEAEYQEMANNVKLYSQRLVSGQNIISALSQI